MTETDGTAAAATQPGGEGMQSTDVDVLRKVVALRAQVRESFGKVVLALMALPRYRHQAIADLQHLVLDPLIRDRIAIAYPGEDTEQAATGDVVGIAIWASVSETVDAKLREQIKARVWPVRLAAEDWTSGEINWLIDVIAPTREATGKVIANFRSVAKAGELRLHPNVPRLVDAEMLERLGLKTGGQG